MGEWIVEKLLGAAGRLLSQIITSLRDRGTFDRVTQLAELWVAKVAGDDTLDGDAKRAAALNGIKQDLVMEGRTVRDSLIALAIELAVGALKAQAR